jgi:hypothetical protein
MVEESESTGIGLVAQPPAATSVEAPAETAQVVQPDKPAEGGDEGAEPVANGRWWSGIEKEGDLREHENVRAWRQEDAESARQETIRNIHGQMQSRLDRRNGHLADIDQTLGSFWGSWFELKQSIESGISEGTISSQDIKSLNDTLTKHDAAFQALARIHLVQGQQEAIMGYRAQSGDVVPGVIDGLFGEDSKAADDWKLKVRNILDFKSPNGIFLPFAGSFFDDLRQALTASAVKQALAEEEPKMEKRIREQLKVEAAARDKGNSPPPAEPKGGSGGGGTGGYRTKAEARTLHVQGKISHGDMRRINADPTIPEM